MKRIIPARGGALLAGFIAAGCATSPPASEVAAAQHALGGAGQAVEQAAADPHVSQYASGELDRASDALGRAKTAWHDRHDLTATTHFAYLAHQRAATAREYASERAAVQAVKLAAEQRDRALSLAARRSPDSRPVAGPQPVQQQGLSGFAFGTATLPAGAAPAIEALASTLKDGSAGPVVIEGHTDNVGDSRYNQALAMRRAQAVRAALVRQGVESGRIVIRSLGEENPVASNDDSAGRRENRRVQVIVGESGVGAMGSSQGATAATASGPGERDAHDAASEGRGRDGQHRQ